MCRYEVSKCCWKNGANRLAQCRVAINLQFVKNTAKCNKARCACIDVVWACVFISLVYVPRGGIAGSYSNSAFSRFKEITLTSR